jgi:hypothetical protein
MKMFDESIPQIMYNNFRLETFVASGKFSRASDQSSKILENLQSFWQTFRASDKPSELLANLQSFWQTFRATEKPPKLEKNLQSFWEIHKLPKKLRCNNITR